MTAITYEVWICDQRGRHLQLVQDFYALTWSRATNSVGAVALSMPYGYAQYVRMPDAILEINRRIEGVSDPLPLAFMCRNLHKFQKGKERKVVVRGRDMNALLDRRITDYPAGSANTSKTMVAANMVREFVIENLGASATNADRRLDSGLFSVQAATGFGYSFTKRATRRGVLPVAQEIARTSYEQGTPVYFDTIVTGVDSAFAVQFRCYRTTRGTDHSASSATPITLSVEDGDLTDIDVEYDYDREVNAVRVAGAGRDDIRQVALREATRWRASPWARVEHLHSDPRLDTAALLNAAGDGVLTARRPRVRMTATLSQSSRVLFGRDYDYGDKLPVSAPSLDESFTAYANAVLFHVTRDGETAQTRFYGEAMI